MNGTERAEELIQARAQARAGINLAEEGRSEAAERRSKAHLGREDPIACPDLAGEGGFRLHLGRIQSKHDRREQIKSVRLKSGERGSVTSGQHGLQRRARGSGRRSGRS